MKRTELERPRRVKLAAVMAAEMSGVVQASKQTGIPHQTISSWLERPEFGEIRRRTREELAEEVKVVAHMAWDRVRETLPTMEPRDALFAAEKASTLLQLLKGEATSRTETKSVTAGMTDHESAALRAVLDEVMAKVEA